MSSEPQTESLPTLVARELNKHFGAIHALRGVDIDLRPQEVVTLLGPNGAGKSTLLRILATTLVPESGTVRICSVDALAAPQEARRHVGMVMGDEHAHYWRISGRRNLEFFGSLYGLSREDLSARVEQLLDQFGLHEAADRPVSSYSSGMRARLTLARALVAQPSVLLLDEPSRSLDPLAARAFRETVRELVSAGDVAALCATHDLHEAAALADRIFVLVAGQVVWVNSGGLTSDELEELLVDEVPVCEVLQ